MIVKIVFICMVAILPSVIGVNETVVLNALQSTITAKAVLGERINGVIKLTKNGLIGQGAFGFTYKGKLYNRPTEYAIKFTSSLHTAVAKKEYEMYTYLNAINTPETEEFGIPVIYYYAEWDQYERVIVMAMTLLSSESVQRMRYKMLTDLDVMIIFREFVKISKYMHSCGVRHNDIKANNMMFRGNKGFIVDFNVASKMAERSGSGTMSYSSRRAHCGQTRYPMDDWENFLYSMCEAVGINLDWQNRNYLMNVNDSALNEFIFWHKNQTHNTMTRINQIGNEKLKRLFVQFAKYVFSGKTIPPYNTAYGMINGEISCLAPDLLSKSVVVSWISGEEKRKARKEQMFSISTISQPTDTMNAYPEVNFDYFTNTGASSSTGKKSKSIMKFFK